MARSVPFFVACMLAVVVPGSALAGPGPAGLEASVRTAIVRSPDDFVAGLFESRGEVACEQERCWTEYTVLESFGSRGRDRRPHPERVRVSFSGTAGHRSGRWRTLGVLVPMEPGRTIYAGTYLSNDTGADAQEALRTAVANVLRREIRDEATIGSLRDAARDLGVTRPIVFAENVVDASLWTIDVWFDDCRGRRPQRRPVRFRSTAGGWRAESLDAERLGRLTRDCS